MKLLFVFDLHCEREKLDWVAEHAVTFDAVSVADDLLNIFIPTTRIGVSINRHEN